MMSGGSIGSLIIFLTLVAFAVTGSMALMLACALIMSSIWYWCASTQLSPHFQNLAHTNKGYSDVHFHSDSDLHIDHSTAILASLRKQLPHPARSIPLHPKNHLFDDLNLDPVDFELEEMTELCSNLKLKYEIEETKPLWEQVSTIDDLTTYIASLKSIEQS